MNSPIGTPLSNVDQIKQRISELRQALELRAPQYESLLHLIHQELRKDEEVVHLLSEEEIGTIVEGLSKKKNIVIVEEKQKSKKPGPKSFIIGENL